MMFTLCHTGRVRQNSFEYAILAYAFLFSPTLLSLNHFIPCSRCLVISRKSVSFFANNVESRRAIFLRSDITLVYVGKKPPM